MSQSSALDEVVFLSTRGERLSGVFYPCRVPALAEKDTVLLVHGLMSDKHVSILHALGTALSEHATCFAFDFPGQGASEGEFEYGGYQRQVDEVQHVIQWLLTEHNRKTNAIIGHSMGGNVVLLHAALFGTVPLVVNLSARYFLDKGILAPSKATDVTEYEASGEFTLRRKGKTFVIRKEVRARERGLAFECADQICESLISHVFSARACLPHVLQSIAERLRTSMGVCANIAPHIRLLTLHGDADEVLRQVSFFFCARLHMRLGLQ